ncbi:FecR family protein [Pareuzebyella sediminis]|uniref:FecR family protein n=1 Tax=Pareuzebyella sediminis TaxID=2607998 RepID=UPI0011F05E54|nr:FecR family protein [Pareuzebyella sediminis]
MIPSEIESCIVKYLTQSGDSKDLDRLDQWLEDETSGILFKQYIKTYFAINLAMDDSNIDNVRQRLLKEIKEDKRRFYKPRFSTFLKYAAIAMVFMGLGFLLKKDVLEMDIDATVIPRENVITLKLGNGDVKIISKDGSSQVVNEKGEVIGNQQGEQIVYQDNTGTAEPDFNTLTIPRGKRFGIVLSDGTKVHLNAGSSLTYPTSFRGNSLRRVVLIGEAFFEVSHDSLRQFVVNTQELDVKVHGTRFNLANYPEDERYEVILVDGSVSMSEVEQTERPSKEMFLEPGFKGILTKNDKQFSNERVNTSLYTSWMDGNLIFRNETFENIIRKLERHYNVVIINNNTNIAEETFNATIETDNETIEQVFNYFEKVYEIDFTIVENKIIIN